MAQGPALLVSFLFPHELVPAEVPAGRPFPGTQRPAFLSPSRSALHFPPLSVPSHCAPLSPGCPSSPSPTLSSLSVCSGLGRAFPLYYLWALN